MRPSACSGAASTRCRSHVSHLERRASQGITRRADRRMRDCSRVRARGPYGLVDCAASSRWRSALGLALAACGGSGGEGAGRRRPGAAVRRRLRRPRRPGRGQAVGAGLAGLRRGRLDRPGGRLGDARSSSRPAARSTVKTFATSAEAVQLFSTGEYDVVSASGDASLRLVYGDRVQPVNTALVPNYADIFPDLKDKPWNTVAGNDLRHPARPRGEPAALQHRRHPTPPTSWKDMWDAGSPRPRARSAPYDDAIYIADAAVYLMATRPELGIKNPYALDQTQFDAAIALLAQQKPLVGRVLGRLRQAGPGPRIRHDRRRARAGSSPRTSPTPTPTHGGHDQARRGRDRLVGHVDGQEGHREHQLRVPVAEPHRVAAR